MDVNPFMPNAAYAALQDAGFSSLVMQHIYSPIMAIHIQPYCGSVTFFFVGVKSYMKQFFFFQALNFLVESFGILNDLFPLPLILDAGYPVFDLHMANVLFYVILPSVLGSSL